MDLEKVVYKDRIESILRKYPETRDCDRLLFVTYLEEYHDVNKNGLRKVMTDIATPSMETLRRHRQLLQAKGMYIGTSQEPRHNKALRIRASIHKL